MCVLLITRLLQGVGRWSRKPVNHTSLVAVVTPTDLPKSVRNCGLIELFCGVVCVSTLPFWHFCWYRGFCHRTGSDLLLFVFFHTCFDIMGWNFSYDFVECTIDQLRVSSLCVHLALSPSIHILHFPPTCIEKLSWNFKFDVGFF